MKGDIFNNGTGYNNCCNNAIGDVFTKTACVYNSPVSDEEFEALRNELARTKILVAQAEAKFKEAKAKLTVCLKMNGVNCESLGGTSEELQVQFAKFGVQRQASVQAYNAALENYNRAEALINKAKEEYRQCMENEQKKVQALAESGDLGALIESDNKQIEAQTQQAQVMQAVETQKSETSKASIKYVVIAIGVLVIGFVSYKMIKK